MGLDKSLPGVKAVLVALSHTSTPWSINEYRVDGKSYEGMIRRGRKVLRNNDEIAAQSRGAQGKRRECKKLSRDILTWGRVGKRAKNE